MATSETKRPSYLYDSDGAEDDDSSTYQYYDDLYSPARVGGSNAMQVMDTETHAATEPAETGAHDTAYAGANDNCVAQKEQPHPTQAPRVISSSQVPRDRGAGADTHTHSSRVKRGKGRHEMGENHRHRNSTTIGGERAHVAEEAVHTSTKAATEDEYLNAIAADEEFISYYNVGYMHSSTSSNSDDEATDDAAGTNSAVDATEGKRTHARESELDKRNSTDKDAGTKNNHSLDKGALGCEDKSEQVPASSYRQEQPEGKHRTSERDRVKYTTEQCETDAPPVMIETDTDESTFLGSRPDLKFGVVEELVNAIENGRVPSVEDLKDFQYLHRHSKIGKLPLARAVACKNFDAVKSLLKAGVDVNATEPYSGRTALHVAAMLPLHQHLGTVSTGIKQFNSVASNIVEYVTPSHDSERIAGLIQHLISSGANMNLVDLFGQPVLFNAVTMPFLYIWQRSNDDIPSIRWLGELTEATGTTENVTPNSPSQSSVCSSIKSIQTAVTDRSNGLNQRRVRKGEGVQVADSGGISASSSSHSFSCRNNDKAGWCVSPFVSWGEHPLDVSTEAIASVLLAVRPIVFSRMFLNSTNAMDMTLQEWISRQKEELQTLLRTILHAFKPDTHLKPYSARSVNNTRGSNIENQAIDDRRSACATRIISGIAVLDRLHKCLDKLLGAIQSHVPPAVEEMSDDASGTEDIASHEQVVDETTSGPYNLSTENSESKGPMGETSTHGPVDDTNITKSEVIALEVEEDEPPELDNDAEQLTNEHQETIQTQQFLTISRACQENVQQVTETGNTSTNRNEGCCILQ